MQKSPENNFPEKKKEKIETKKLYGSDDWNKAVEIALTSSSHDELVEVMNMEWDVKGDYEDVPDINRIVRYWIKSKVVDNPNIPPDLLMKLSEEEEEKDGFSDFKGSIAENPNVTPEILDKLSNSPMQNVRKTVAESRHTPPEILKKMIPKEKDFLEEIKNLAKPSKKEKNEAFERLEVIEKALSNPNLTTSMLEELFATIGKPCELFETEMYGGVGVTGVDFKSLTSEPYTFYDYHVRKGFVFNPNTPIHILRDLDTGEKRFKLKEDRDAIILAFSDQSSTAGTLEKSFDNYKESHNSFDFGLVRVILSNSNTPLHILEDIRDYAVFRGGFSFEEVEKVIAKRKGELPSNG